MFLPGNTENLKRKTFGGGRPGKAELSLREEVIRQRELKAAKIAETYLKFANEDPATMRHLIDKVLPAAPTKVDIGINISRQSVVAILANEQGKAAALAVTKLLAERRATEISGSSED